MNATIILLTNFVNNIINYVVTTGIYSEGVSLAGAKKRRYHASVAIILSVIILSACGKNLVEIETVALVFFYFVAGWSS